MYKSRSYKVKPVNKLLKKSQGLKKNMIHKYNNYKITDDKRDLPEEPVECRNVNATRLQTQ